MAPPDAKLAQRNRRAALAWRLSPAPGGWYQERLGVVLPSPSFDQNAGFRQGVEDLPISNSALAVEGFGPLSRGTNRGYDVFRDRKSHTFATSVATMYPMTVNLKRRRRCGSTLSLEIAIDGRSQRKLFRRICLAANGRNGNRGVARAMLTMLPKLALLVIEMY
jgi:hypothetical protein